MAASRRKAPKQEAPQTIEQAVAGIVEYRDLIDKQDELKADAARSIAAIEAARDEFAAPIKARADTLFRQLRVWWGVAAPEMTDSKRKSIELAGCVIGERTAPPSLKHDGMKAEALVDDLADLCMAELLKVTTKLDKQACIRAIRDGDELGQLLVWLGARNHQAEEFFIDRAGKKDADPEIVDIEEAAE
ncbi:host-nuclease inhibitor Gam family protein [Sphingobium aromaticiconvertens]|uniref:host-nuclease inhibitor Gam family protein n=1 Tax=Sphingobium aromaticiconvertens TaxID=365341 RepID=UPI003016751A